MSHSKAIDKLDLIKSNNLTIKDAIEGFDVNSLWYTYIKQNLKESKIGFLTCGCFVIYDFAKLLPKCSDKIKSEEFLKNLTEDLFGQFKLDDEKRLKEIEKIENEVFENELKEKKKRIIADPIESGPHIIIPAPAPPLPISLPPQKEEEKTKNLVKEEAIKRQEEKKSNFEKKLISQDAHLTEIYSISVNSISSKFLEEIKQEYVKHISSEKIELESKTPYINDIEQEFDFLTTWFEHINGDNDDVLSRYRNSLTFKKLYIYFHYILTVGYVDLFDLVLNVPFDENNFDRIHIEKQTNSLVSKALILKSFFGTLVIKKNIFRKQSFVYIPDIWMVKKKNLLLLTKRNVEILDLEAMNEQKKNKRKKYDTIPIYKKVAMKICPFMALVNWAKRIDNFKLKLQLFIVTNLLNMEEIAFRNYLSRNNFIKEIIREKIDPKYTHLLWGAFESTYPAIFAQIENIHTELPFDLHIDISKLDIFNTMLTNLETEIKNFLRGDSNILSAFAGLYLCFLFSCYFEKKYKMYDSNLHKSWKDYFLLIDPTSSEFETMTISESQPFIIRLWGCHWAVYHNGKLYHNDIVNVFFKYFDLIQSECNGAIKFNGTKIYIVDFLTFKDL